MRKGIFAAMAVLIVAVAGVAFAVDDEDIFELDGNAFDDGAPGDDWETLWDDCGVDGDPEDPATACGNSFAFTGIRPDTFVPTNQDGVFTGGASKDDIDIPSNWKWKQAKPTPDKNNITNAYSAAYNRNGDTLIYYGADRFANNGDAQIGFWFFQQAVAPLDDGTFSGQHEDGDLLVLANFTGGGQTSNVEIWEWCAGCGTDGNTNLALLVSAGDCTDDPNALACALANTMAEPSPWPYTPKSGPSGTFPVASFFEGGLNLSGLFPEGTPCFSAFLAETRSSSSTDAVLKDFAFGGFPLCAIDATKECVNDTEDDDTPGSLTYNVRGCAINDGGGDVTMLSLLNSIGGGMNMTPADLAWFTPPAGFMVPDDCSNATALLDAVQNGTSFDPDNDVLTAGQAVVYQFPETTAANAPTDTVTIDAEGVDGTAIDAANASATCPQVLFPASLAVDKSCSVSVEDAGETLVVRIDISGEVCNTGDLELTNVRLVDDPAMPTGTVTITPQNFTLAPNGAEGGADCQSYTGFYYPNSIPNGDLCPFMDQVEATATADGAFADPGAPGCEAVGDDVDCSATSNSITCELRIGDGDGDCATGLKVDPPPPAP